MAGSKVTDFILFLRFELAKKLETRQKMLDFVKGFISSIGAVQKSKVDMTKRTMAIGNKGFGVFFTTKRFFIIACGLRNEETTNSLNEILNEVLKRINEQNWKEASKIYAYSTLDSEISNKLDPYSKLIRQDIIKNLLGTDKGFEPKRLEIWQPPGTEPREGFYIISKKKVKILECVRSNVYTDKLPMDLVTNYYSELKKQSERILEQIVGEMP